MKADDALMLKLLTAIWTRMKEASERFAFDYDAANFDVSVLPDRGRSGIWRCRISHDAHRHRIAKAVGQTRYFREAPDIVALVTQWAEGLADEHGRLHQRDRAMAPYCRRAWDVPDWAMTAPEIMTSITEWAGTSMMAMHAGNPDAILARLSESLSMGSLAKDGDRYLADEIVVRKGKVGGWVFSVQIKRDRIVMTLMQGVNTLPETVIQGMAGQLLGEMVAHPALQSATRTRIVSAEWDDDVLKLTLDSPYMTIATPPAGVDMSWLRTE